MCIRDRGIFAKDITYRILEELTGYIGDLKEGALLASSHHMRVLIELFATVEAIVIDTKNDHKKSYLKRYIRFHEIVYYKIYHQHEGTILELPEEISYKYFKEYAELPDELLSIFNKKRKDQLVQMQTWRGDCSIKDLLEQLPHRKEHLKNYDHLCLFTHCSPLVKYYKTQLFPEFKSSDENMLPITLRYAVDIFIHLKSVPFSDESTIKRLQDVFLSVAPSLVPKLNLSLIHI